MEQLKTRARLYAAETSGTLAIAVYGVLAGEAGSATSAELLIVVQADGADGAGGAGGAGKSRDEAAAAFEQHFADVSLDIHITVLTRADFKDRIAQGDPWLAGVRDGAVLLYGALPIAEIGPW